MTTPFDNSQPSVALTKLIVTQGAAPVAGDGSGLDGNGIFTIGMVRNFAGGFSPLDTATLNGQMIDPASSSES